MLKVPFKDIKLGAKFHANGNTCVKSSSRTARIVQFGRVFYFAQNEQVTDLTQRKGFSFESWHAWEGEKAVLLSDESVKKLRSFATWDACINWLFVNEQKPAARALNAHIKGVN